MVQPAISSYSPPLIAAVESVKLPARLLDNLENIEGSRAVDRASGVIVSRGSIPKAGARRGELTTPSERREIE